MASRHAWMVAACLQGGLGAAVAPALFLALPAVAAERQVASAPRITAFDVQAIDKVEAGAELDFTLWGTPGALAVLRIDGAQRPLTLQETAPGRYEGVYTISRRDRIAAGSAVNANLRHGNRVATALLDEPLQQGYVPAPVAAASAPQISHFDVRADTVGSGGSTLLFGLDGSPGGRASVVVPGTRARTVMLDETRPGHYEGRYTLQAGDQIEADRPVRARLRVGEVSITRLADNNLQSVTPRPVAAVSCVDCGKVLAINRVEVAGDGSYVGATAGGVLGAVVGSQIGQGNGRTAAGVAGAIGGALLGREIERRNSRTVHYEVLVRLDSGGQRTVSFDNPPNYRVGDRVQLSGNSLQMASS